MTQPCKQSEARQTSRVASKITGNDTPTAVDPQKRQKDERSHLVRPIEDRRYRSFFPGKSWARCMEPTWTPFAHPVINANPTA